LDAYSGETDERMLELLRESKERSGGHWFYCLTLNTYFN
jgi:hypothetical protein